MKRAVNILFSLLLIFSSCKKEPELITGRIAGRMTIYDQLHTSLPDRSGIELTLLGPESAAGTVMTDADGSYQFDDLPYGKYRIRMRKDGYVEGYNPPFFYHVGGYSPTYINMSIYEVPKYDLSLDSVTYDPEYGYIILHLKVDGDTVITRNAYGYPFIAYAGSSPEVSVNNYISTGKGYLRDYWILANSPKVAVYGRIAYYDFIPQIEDAITGTVYLRIYPLAQGQGYGAMQFYKEALGKPSNVITFRWDDIAGKQ